MFGLVPTEVQIDPATGVISPATGGFARRLSDLDGTFQDRQAARRAMIDRDDPLVYEVAEFKCAGSDLFFGTTTMQPGKIGDEFFMTRGHFHQRPDMGEVYCTQSGSGLLLLESRDGRSETIEMRPGSCAFIPPDWAHRSINIGSSLLVFTWFCNVLAGNDYASIARRGMRKLVVDRGDKAEVIDNPGWV